MEPKIGELRTYVGDEPEVLYPGERASATRNPGEPMLWTVEPEPGVVAAFRRFRYRAVGQWLERLRARRTA